MGVGQRGVVEGKWRQLYLNNNLKIALTLLLKETNIKKINLKVKKTMNKNAQEGILIIMLNTSVKLKI